ncbi:MULTISPECIES: DEAD/DEAH box helicase [Colwellia]|uniref:Helicase n=1 Tax=Colwellia marinimaniae TaxID=1513592 RepID=A0ABQ0MUR9_9GAMM|nr:MULTISPECIES: helicase-related protein [Colwellia]GAW96100.1 helicase [Colwellia marinimaniae]
MQILEKDYQINSVNKAINAGGNSIIALPTGGGKSICILKLCQALSDKKVVISLRNAALIPQLLNTLTSNGLSVSVVKSGYEYIAGGDVTLVMEQSFARRKYLNIECDVLLRDEYHVGCMGGVYIAMREELAPDLIIGLTATPIDRLGVYIDKSMILIEETTTKQLIDLGELAKPVYKVPSLSQEIDYSAVKMYRGDFSASGLDCILLEHCSLVAQQTVDDALSHGRKVMLFANSIKHVEALSEAFDLLGVQHEFVHSQRSGSDNDESIRRYKSNEVRLIINMSMLTIGFDDPTTDCVVLARPTKILRLYLQIIGRCLRASKGKANALILDLAQCISTHGFAEDYRDFTRKTAKSAAIMSERLSVTNIAQFVDGEFSYHESIERKLVKRKPSTIRKPPRPTLVTNKDLVDSTAKKRAASLARLNPKMEKLVSTIELVNIVYEQQDESSKMLDELDMVKLVALIGFAYSDALVDSCIKLVEDQHAHNKSIRGLLLRVSNLITAIARKDLAIA